MKKLLTLLVAAVMSMTLALGLTACESGTNSAGKTLYVYTNAGFAPYEYVDVNGKVVGVDMDIMKEVGDVLGYNVVINDIEFKNILNEVQNNEFAVGAAGMTKRGDRDEVATASIVYATSVQYVILPKTATVATNGEGKVELASLAGMKIGVQAGTTGSFLVEDNTDGYEDDAGATVGVLMGTGASYTEYSNAIIASADIGSSLDAVVIDKLPAQSICKANANLVCYELNEEPESYVLYFNNGATELIAQVNKVLQAMIDNGVIDYYTVKHSGGIIG